MVLSSTSYRDDGIDSCTSNDAELIQFESDAQISALIGLLNTSKGSFMNDVTQLGGEGVSQCVTPCDRWGGGGSP